MRRSSRSQGRGDRPVRDADRAVHGPPDGEATGMDKRKALANLVEDGVTRRRFAASVLLFGGAAGTALGIEQAELLAQGINDLDILNFALNLEYLEAEFYTVATYGRRISEVGIETGGRGRVGPTVGGAAVALTGFNRVAAEHITLDEQEHVKFLRAALGSNAVAKPAINLEALGVGFRNQNEFLILARAFEDLGVSAYGGAAPLIDRPGNLRPAVQIALTEAQHAGVLRMLVAQANIPVPMIDGMDVPPLGSPAGRLFQVDGNGRSGLRTPNQVLAVAYANTASGTSSGGFFPEGVNGTIRSV